jgi:hypothetical protein
MRVSGADQQPVADQQGHGLREIESGVGAEGLFDGIAKGDAVEQTRRHDHHGRVDLQHHHLQTAAKDQSRFGPCQIDVFNGDAAAWLVSSPERHRRVWRMKQLQAGMQLPTQLGEALGIGQQGGDGGGFQDRYISRVQGLQALPFQSRHISQVGQAGGGRKLGDEAGQRLTVVGEHAGARRVGEHKNLGHGAEEFFAHQLQRHRKSLGQRVHQRDHHIVAVHSQALRRVAAVPGAESLGCGL